MATPNQIELTTANPNPDQLTAAAGILYFTANDGEHGRELWALPLPR